MTASAAHNIAWIAADWGTTHLRLWPMNIDGQAVAQVSSDKGMGRISKEAYEPVLLSLLEPYLSDKAVLSVVCCGMAGSRQGWDEAPYAETPCAPPSIEAATRVKTSDSRIAVYILPGVKQFDPADVMRGEETQIAGVLARRPDLDGVICLPGTHTKWARISGGEISGFATFMSGELFQLLSSQSVLRHSVASEGWDESAFLKGCSDAREAPARLASALFSLRAQALLNDMSPVESRSRLSGLLVGAEIEAARDSWQGKSVVIVGESGMAAAYETALRASGAEAHRTSAEEATLDGLRAAYKNLNKKD